MTDLKAKLINMSKETTNDDGIIAAGDFQPKGLTWKRAAAAGAGSLAGSEMGDNSGLGAAAGYAIGTYAGTSGNIPPVVVVAISKENLYILTTTNAKGNILAKALVLLDTLKVEDLRVEMHQKLTVRTVVISDDSTGHEYKLEGKRILFHHMNDLLDALDEATSNQ